MGTVGRMKCLEICFRSRSTGKCRAKWGWGILFSQSSAVKGDKGTWRWLGSPEDQRGILFCIWKLEEIWTFVIDSTVKFTKKCHLSFSKKQNKRLRNIRISSLSFLFSISICYFWMLDPGFRFIYFKDSNTSP